MSINLNSRNNTLCCKVNDLYTALMASELLNDCVDDVVVMLKTCVDYVNIVSSQEVQIQHARFTMDGEEFRQYVMEQCYAILSHYSNEDIGTFDSVAICGGVHMSFESAKKAADEMLAVDKENGCHDDAVPYTLDDCKEFDDLPLYIAGEWAKDKFEHYHNFYAVFEQDAAL